MSREFTIQRKLISLFLIFSLIPLAVGAFFAYTSSQRTIEQNIGSKLEVLASNTIDEIDKLLFFRKEDIKAWAATDIMQGVISNDPDGYITRTLSRLKSGYGVYSGIFCINPEGKIIASSEQEKIDQDVFDEPWFKEMVKTPKLQVIDLKYDKIIGGLSVKFNFPIVASNDESHVIGFLSSNLNWSELFDITNTIEISKEGQTESSYAVLINKMGFVISGPGFILAEEAGKEELFSRNLLSRGYKSAQLGIKGERGFLIESAPSGSEFLIGYAGSQGYRDFEGLDWTLLIMQDTKQAFLPVIKLRNQFIIIGSGVGIFVIAFAVMISMGISVPIRKLAVAANVIAKGNLSHRVKVKSGDEMGILATNFNKMAEALTNEIIERRRAEQSLLASEEKLGITLRSIGDAVISTNTEGLVVLMNPVAEQLTGWKGEEAQGKDIKKIFRIVNEETGAEVEDQVTKILKEDVVVGLASHTVLISKNGTRIPIDTSCAPIKDYKGNVEGVVLVFKDITEKRKAELVLNEYSKNLEKEVAKRAKDLHAVQEQLIRKEKLAFLGQLAAGVAHELRNPLCVISNAIYFLETVNLEADETTKEYLEIIKDEVKNSESIVTDLLDFSSIKPAAKEEIGVFDLTARILEKNSPPENVKITTSIDSNLPAVYVDPQQIKHILVNLVTNGYQAMPDGGELNIKAIADKDNILVSVRDTGCGISEEEMGKLFEPLFTTKARGIGLGLSITKILLQANDGNIEVESEKGKGSIFTISLPTKGD